jgi:hypothetical protein
MCEGDGIAIKDSPIPFPGDDEREVVPAYPWTITAHNKKVAAGWEKLCSQIFENSKRCYVWLMTDPTRRIPGRCYELKHKHYQGVWCFEIGSGQRIYYRVRTELHDVLVYYAGPHPSKVPYPPS